MGTPPVVLPNLVPKEPGTVTSTGTSNRHPYTVQVQGRSLLVPRTNFSRAVMGNQTSATNQTSVIAQKDGRPISNLSVLMRQQELMDSSKPTADSSERQSKHEVQQLQAPDSPRNKLHPRHHLGSSAPLNSSYFIPDSTVPVAPPQIHRNASMGAIAGDRERRYDIALCLFWRASTRHCQSVPCHLTSSVSLPFVLYRRLSSRELVTLAPPSGSPYAAMLHRKEEIEAQTRQRLAALVAARQNKVDASNQSASVNDHSEDSNSSSTARKREGANQSRTRRRSEHYHAVVNDLCEIVADLFLAESKLIKPVQYGVPDSNLESPSSRDQVMQAVQNFVSALPTRYALGADTPSEVLLHMRLMAAARAEKTKAVIHIHSLQDDSLSHRQVAISSLSAERQRSLRLVTICCSDADGLLEVITKNLSSGGSRVMDADVMLSSDGVALDRFVVEMTGRLRLDKLSQRIEAFLKHTQSEKERSSSPLSSSVELGGSIYFNETKSPNVMTDHDIQEEILTAVPLLDVLDSSRHQQVTVPPEFPDLRKTHSMPVQLESRYAPVDRSSALDVSQVRLPVEPDLAGGVPIPTSPGAPTSEYQITDKDLLADPTPKSSNTDLAGSNRQRRPLVNRAATYDLDGHGYTPKREKPTEDYLTVPTGEEDVPAATRKIPLIPFEELMLIETIGTGRVSTIYRAVWQRPERSTVRMVALKVAMVNGVTGDTSHVDELRREADIAARLTHPNICDLCGVAADSDCFCLAYDYAEGGSLHSLLSDSSRYYEYLPIALDVANGMAYLHSRNIIHRDLKPSNILLTRDHRAKICDFGMSVMNAGQELTAETGTYRYMAPEVIRHESYSSNADVYSFGICLWQLITREVPFANMTPIQAAYAVAEGRRPVIPPSTPRRLQEIIMACWDQDSYRRPSFTYIAMALADYAKMAFSPANVGALTLQIANEMLATVQGNSTVNVDFTTPVSSAGQPQSYLMSHLDRSDSNNSDVGLEI